MKPSRAGSYPKPVLNDVSTGQHVFLGRASQLLFPMDLNGAHLRSQDHIAFGFQFDGANKMLHSSFTKYKD